jgi:putative cell wall-binding protein
MRRSATFGVLAWLLVIGLMVPAGAHAPASTGVASSATGPARTDVAEMARGVAWGQYLQDRAFAAAADTVTDPGATAAVRRDLRTAFAEETAVRGTQADAGVSYARAGAPASRWYDTCNDAEGSRLDLRGTISVRRDDQQGFLGYTCHPWATPDIGDGAFIWALYTPEYEEVEEEPTEEPTDGETEEPDDDATEEPEPPTSGGELGIRYPDFLVSVFQHRGALETVVVRTPDRDPATWYLTWRAQAERIDEHAFDVVVPVKAFGKSPDAPEWFHFEWAMIDAHGRTDLFPNDYVTLVNDVAAFPQVCEEEYVGQVAVTPAAPVAPDSPGTTWTLPTVSAPEGLHSGGVTVAVIDDGVDLERAGLRGRAAPAYDARFQAAIGTDSDRGGHGTAVAGMLAAARTQGAGIAGMDTGARILPVRVVDTDGCITAETLAAGIRHAADAGAQVINVSIAGPEHPDLRKAVDDAQARGALIVAAAGNVGPQGPALYPAAYPGVVGVGAMTHDRRPTSYSAGARAVDVLAPGGDASGRADRDVVSFWELGQLRPQHGTGIAAPFVSGALALYLNVHEGMNPRSGDVRRALEATIDDLGVTGHDPDHGYGILNVARLLGMPPMNPERELLERIDEEHPADVAIAVSARRFPQGAPHVVLVRHDVFADALAGAPLTATGPLLLSGQTTLPEGTSNEISRVLAPGGKVYLLGGTQAIGEGVADHLRSRGYVVHRLAGPTRVETSVAIGHEVRALYPGSASVGLARAFGTAADETAAWADAITGGAWAAHTRSPLLVTTSAQLHPAVAATLNGWAPQQTVLFGGSAALSQAVESAAINPRRVAGPDRAATAVAVADLWSARAGFTVINGYIPSGWAYGMAAAGLGADTGRPLVLTTQNAVPAATYGAVRSRCDQGPVTLIGSAAVIGGSVEAELAMAASC